MKVKPGRPSDLGDQFIINRENLCIECEEGQDREHFIFRVHFDKDALKKALDTCCMASLFGVDVMENYMKIFIRGDERSAIMMGELGGNVIPEKTTWEIVQALPPKDPNNPQAMRTGHFASTLQIKALKAEDSQLKWAELINENPQALARDNAPEKIEEMKQKMLRSGSPDKTHWAPSDHAKYNKGKGDNCFKNSEWRDASVYYTRGISHTPEDQKLYSNRSACYYRLKKYEKALKDAQKCISLGQSWPKGYFRLGQAYRGLKQWDEARNAFSEGKFRQPGNPDWDKEIDKTDDEQYKNDEHEREQARLRREADNTTHLNEETTKAEREAMMIITQQARAMGKSGKEVGELAMRGAEMAKQRVHEMAAQKAKMTPIGDDYDLDNPPPYRIVREDGSLHGKGFAHTDKGMYFMGMVMMNWIQEPRDQPWIELRHPGKMRWSQGCGRLKLKITMPPGVKTGADVEVDVTTGSIRIGTIGDSDPVIIGDFERKVEPFGEDFAWYLIPDEDPPMIEMTLNKDNSDVYCTQSFGTLLWPRLFKDDVVLGEGLFEADLTDLPAELLAKYNRDQARESQLSADERTRRKRMTEEEIGEETARQWNDEFAKHGMPNRLDTNESRMVDHYKY